MKKFFTLILPCIAFAVASPAATFTSIVASGNYNSPSSWSFSGTDADGIPDSDDNVIISSGNTIKLVVSSNSKNLTINAGGTINMNSLSMLVWGSFTNNGTSVGSGSWQFRSGGTYSGNNIPNNGIVYFYANYSIAAGVSIFKPGSIVVASNCTVTNHGSINLTANGVLTIGTGGKWINATGSSMTVSANGVNNGILDASAVPNNFIYATNGYSSVIGTNATYYNLTLNTQTTGVKALQGNLNVLNNLTLGTGVTLNCASNNITLGGNWINNANTTCTNMNTISFTGSGTQTITRATGTREFFKNVQLNGTGTVLLNDTLTLSGTLDINSGVLDVNTGNFTINITGNFNDNATFNGRLGTVNFNGTSAQTIDGISSTVFYNIKSSNPAGVTINFGKALTNLLSVSAGSFGPSAFGSFTLRATGPTTYARIGPVGGSLTGNTWVIKSYVNGPATAYWQYLSTPVTGNTLNDWDADPRFYMSGVGGNDGNACCPVFYSVRTYNTASNTYTNITSIGTALTSCKGYMLWMADNLNSLTAPLVYDSRGAANFGNKSISVTAGGSGAGYNLVGNPYACPVNFSAVRTASGNLGANFMILQENGSYATNPNGGVIGPNQGFMVIASSSGPMQFTEACKNTTTNPNLIRSADPENYLRIATSNSVNGLGGEAVVQIVNDAHNGFDIDYDMPFLASPYDDATNIWSTDMDGKALLLNAVDGNAEALDIPLTVRAASLGDQLISFRGLNGFSAYSCAILEDLVSGEKINLKEQDTYSFPATGLGEEHSFTLHLQRNGNCPLNEQGIVASLDAQTQVFNNNGNILVKFGFEDLTDVQVSVYNTEGQEVAAPKDFSVASETVKLDNPGAHGIYFVRIVRGEEMITRKIYY